MRRRVNIKGTVNAIFVIRVPNYTDGLLLAPLSTPYVVVGVGNRSRRPFCFGTITIPNHPIARRKVIGYMSTYPGAPTDGSGVLI